MEFDPDDFKGVIVREVLMCGGEMPVREPNIGEYMKELQAVLEEPPVEGTPESMRGDEIDEFLENLSKKPSPYETMVRNN